MKLRLDVSNYDLGFRFGISASTVSQVFSKWFEAMDICLSFLITWPDRENLRKSMPFCVRPNYALKITSIIDCLLKSLQTCLQNHVPGHNINITQQNISLPSRQKELSVSFQMGGEVESLTSTLLRTRAPSNIYFRGIS